MEATTPKNNTGFDRKLKSKNRKSNRKPGRRKGDFNPAAMPSEATAWFYGSMFLMAAAKILAPFIGLNVPAPQSVNVTND